MVALVLTFPAGFLDDLVDDLVKEAETPLHTHTSPRGEPSRSSRQQSHREPRDEEDDEGRRTRSRRRTKARKQRSVHATMGIEPGAPYSQRLPRRHDKQDGSRPSTAPAGRRRGRRNGSSRGDGRSNRGKGRDSTGPIYFVDPDTVAAEPNSLYSESFLERDDHMRDSLLYDAIVGDSGDDDDDGSDPDFLRPNLRWGAGESGRRSSAHRGGAAIWAEEDARMVTTLRKRLTAASMVLEDQQDAIEALAAEKDRADEELSANAAEVAMFERQIAVLEKARGADLELYEMEVGQIRAEAAAQVKRARKRARKARTEMRKTKKELKRKDEVLQAKVKRYEEEIRVLADRSGDTAGLKAQVKQLRAAVASRDSRIRDLEYQAQVGVELTKDQADREREFAAQKKVDAARNEVSRVKNAKAALEAEVVRLTADCDRLRGEVGDTGRLMAKIERLRGDLERQTAHAKALNLKLNKVTHENINLNMDMETLREQVERLQRGLPPPRPAPPRVASVPTAASTAHRHSPGPEPGGSASDTAGASKKTRARAAGKKSGGRSARRARVAAPARSSGGGGGGGGVPLPGKMGARKSRSRGPSRASKGAGSGAGRSTKRGRRSKQGSGP